MNEFQEYLSKALCYAHMEYGTPLMEVEHFEKTANANIFMDIAFNCMAGNKPFQECAYKIVASFKQMNNMPEDAIFESFSPDGRVEYSSETLREKEQ